MLQHCSMQHCSTAAETATDHEAVTASESGSAEKGTYASRRTAELLRDGFFGNAVNLFHTLVSAYNLPDTGAVCTASTAIMKIGPAGRPTVGLRI